MMNNKSRFLRGFVAFSIAWWLIGCITIIKIRDSEKIDMSVENESGLKQSIELDTRNDSIVKKK